MLLLLFLLNENFSENCEYYKRVRVTKGVENQNSLRITTATCFENKCKFQ